MSSTRGSLIVVGTGIRPGLQTTPEARAAIVSSSRIFYLLADPLGVQWLTSLRPDAVSLASCYRDGRERLDSYAEMVDWILGAVSAGDDVCAAFYGHPGVFVRPAHEAIRRARRDGFQAAMLPGVSAEDALFADVGFDPAAAGCQSHAAEDFLIEERGFDPRSALVLWQVGVIGEDRHRTSGYRPGAVVLLVDALLRHFPEDHEVVVYEANELPIGPPLIHRTSLSELPAAPLGPRSTLLVPPLGARQRNPAIADRIASLLASG